MHLTEEPKNWYLANFNSIKVRLERTGEAAISGACQFQFHKGTIRTSQRRGTRRGAGAFQFHKGTIRTHNNWLGTSHYGISIP